MTDYFQITFKNRLTEKRQRYMDVAFDSFKEAQDELNRVNKQRKKKKYSIKELRLTPHQYLRSWMVGTDWKIEPLKISKL